MNAVVEITSPLLFTDNAARKVKELIEEEGNPDLKLRVFVSGGGCSGFQYKFDLVEAPLADAHFPFDSSGDSNALADESIKGKPPA